jgi:hypothetical protein
MLQPFSVRRKKSIELIPDRNQSLGFSFISHGGKILNDMELSSAVNILVIPGTAFPVMGFTVNDADDHTVVRIDPAAMSLFIEFHDV